ncbi:MAG: hypothetical protein JWP52_4590 [Rhizobacter sp.]|nr:hypothetical protein [Rhizobacter sp.]
MKTIDRRAEIRSLLVVERAAGRQVAMIGTSGGTHEGVRTALSRDALGEQVRHPARADGR